MPALLMKPTKPNCGMPGVDAQVSFPGSAFARFANPASESTSSEAVTANARKESEAETIEEQWELFRERGGGSPLRPLLNEEELEAEHLRRVLASCPTMEEAAEVLGIDPSTLYRKRKRYGL